MFTPKARAAFFEKLHKSGRLNPALDKIQMPKVHMLVAAPKPMESYDKLNEQDPDTTPPADSASTVHFKKLKKLWA